MNETRKDILRLPDYSLYNTSQVSRHEYLRGVQQAFQPRRNFSGTQTDKWRKSNSSVAIYLAQTWRSWVSVNLNVLRLTGCPSLPEREATMTTILYRMLQ